MANELSSPASDAPRILFIDDDADVQKAAAMLLPRRGFALRSARSPEECWSLLAEAPVDVVLLDLNFQPGSTTGAEGMRCLERLVAHDPDMVVVVVTGHSGIAIAVAAMRAGAADFVMKPWSNERLVATLNDAAGLRRRRRDARAGRAETMPAALDETPVIGDSQAMRRVLELAHRAAATDAPILLLGEAGTGKSLLARTIHRLSMRAVRPLHRLDAAMPAEDEAGVLASLDPKGTLLIDDVDALSPPRQGRLLDVLARHPRLRAISTSRQPIHLLRGLLQAELLYRLGTIELVLPPLRDRGDDVRLLAEHALRLSARRYGRVGMTLSPDTVAVLAPARFADNVRELFQLVERAVVLSQGGVVEPRDIPLQAPLPDGVPAPVAGDGDLNLARSEKAVIEAALRRHGFNVSHAAKELGLTRATLYRRMARHGL